MNQREKDQHARALIMGNIVRKLDLTKYGYDFDSGPIRVSTGELMGNVHYYYWKQRNGHLSFDIAVSGRISNEKSKDDEIDFFSDCLIAHLNDTRKENRYLSFNKYSKINNFPLDDLDLNDNDLSLEEFTNRYLDELKIGLETYLNDFIMGRRFETTSFDRGDY